MRQIVQAGLFCLLFGIVLADEALEFNAGYFGYGDRPVDYRYVKSVYDADIGPSENVETTAENELNGDLSAYIAAQQSTPTPQTQPTTETVIEIKPTSPKLNRGPATFPPLPSDDPNMVTSTKPPPVRNVQLVPGTVKYTNVEYKPTPYVVPPPAVNPTTANSVVPLPSYPADIRSYQSSSPPSFSSDSSFLPPLPTALPPIFSRPGNSYSYYTVPVRSSGIHSRLVHIPAYPSAAGTPGGILDHASLVGNSHLGLESQLGDNLQSLNGIPSIWNTNDNFRTSYLSGKYPRRKKTVDSEVGNER